MDFNEYQTKSRKTAGYPPIGHPVIYPTLGLVNEAGEVAGKIKKVFRDKDGQIGEETRQARKTHGHSVGEWRRRDRGHGPPQHLVTFARPQTAPKPRIYHEGPRAGSGRAVGLDISAMVRWVPWLNSICIHT